MNKEITVSTTNDYKLFKSLPNKREINQTYLKKMIASIRNNQIKVLSLTITLKH
jgi:hypothetical protein